MFGEKEEILGFCSSDCCIGGLGKQYTCKGICKLKHTIADLMVWEEWGREKKYKLINIEQGLSRALDQRAEGALLNELIDRNLELS